MQALWLLKAVQNLATSNI